MGYELTGLVPNQQYYDQAWVEAQSDGVEQRQSAPQIVGFRTKGPPPVIVGSPTALFVSDQSAALSALFIEASSVVMFDQLNPENAPTTYWFEYAPGQKALAQCPRPIECFSGPGVSCGGVERTPLGESAVYGSIGVSAEAVGLRPGLG